MKNTPGGISAGTGVILRDPFPPGKGGTKILVAVIVRFKRPVDRHPDVIGLFLGEPGELYPEFSQMQLRDFFVQVSRSHIIGQSGSEVKVYSRC